MNWTLLPALIFYGTILSLLFIYGLNFYYLAYLTRKNRGQDASPPDVEELPAVTVQLPIYNERHVARRLIERVGELDWPSDRLQIQVLDDSTDETTSIASAAVRQLQQSGLQAEHVQRPDRGGYKAGALAHGLKTANGDFIAIFDADFLPPNDFLRRTIPHFKDQKVGFVQTRWGHLNRDYSLFTRLQSQSIDGHFMVEQFARFKGGFFLNFNGTAGVWRRQAIEEAGGWSAETLTEDLDLSYRAQLAGWQPVYLRSVETPAELPINMAAYRRQQYRWARGSFETARRMVPRIIKAPLDWWVKAQALLHLTGYGIHALMFLLALVYPLVVVLSRNEPNLVALFGLATIFNFTALAPTTYFTLAQVELGRRWWRELPSILFLSILGSGMMVNNVQAIIHAFTKGTGVFERTPKYGVVGKDKQQETSSYRSPISPLILAELIMLAFNLNTLRLSIQIGHTFIGIYSAIFALGLLYVLALTLWHQVEPWLNSWSSRTTNREAKKRVYQEG